MYSNPLLTFVHPTLVIRPSLSLPPHLPRFCSLSLSPSLPFSFPFFCHPVPNPLTASAPFPLVCLLQVIITIQISIWLKKQKQKNQTDRKLKPNKAVIEAPLPGHALTSRRTQMAVFPVMMTHPKPQWALCISPSVEGSLLLHFSLSGSGGTEPTFQMQGWVYDLSNPMVNFGERLKGTLAQRKGETRARRVT